MKILVLVYTIILIVLAVLYFQNSRTIKELTAKIKESDNAFLFEEASCKVELKKEKAAILDSLRREEATILDNCRGK